MSTWIFISGAVLIGLLEVTHRYFKRVADWYDAVGRSGPAEAIASYESKPWWIRVFEVFAG